MAHSNFHAKVYGMEWLVLVGKCRNQLITHERRRVLAQSFLKSLISHSIKSCVECTVMIIINFMILKMGS